MNKSFFSIEGTSANIEELNNIIEKNIEQKEKEGIYNELNIKEITKVPFIDIEDEREFMRYYLNVINTSWAIDINDFEIPQKNGLSGKIELKLKKIIWKLLKFYTYRLFSQQIEFNSQIRNTLIAVQKEVSQKLDTVEKQLKELKHSN